MEGAIGVQTVGAFYNLIFSPWLSKNTARVSAPMRFSSISLLVEFLLARLPGRETEVQRAVSKLQESGAAHIDNVMLTYDEIQMGKILP
jgi:hypothetical protein